MKRFLFALILVLAMAPGISAETIDVLIKGMDDGVRTNKQQDYKEAVLNAKLEAIERAGVEISAITRVVNFQTKFDMVESRAKAILLPGFQIVDMEYQTDGTYAVVLYGKIDLGEKDASEKILGSPEKLGKYLLEAAANGDLKTAKKLLKQGVYVNVKDEKGNTPLHRAVQNKRFAMVKLLVSANADVGLRNDGGWSPFGLATCEGQIDTLKFFLEHYPKIASDMPYMRRVLGTAVSAGRKETVEFLLSRFGDEIVDEKILTFSRDDEIGRLLLHKGASIEGHFISKNRWILEPRVFNHDRKKKEDIIQFKKNGLKILFSRYEATDKKRRTKDGKIVSVLARKQEFISHGNWLVDKGDLIIRGNGSENIEEIVFPLHGQVSDSYAGKGISGREYRLYNKESKWRGPFKTETKSAKAFLGVGVQDISEEMRNYLNLEKGPGVLVSHVFRASAAEKFGIRVQDVIVSLDDERIRTGKELKQVISRMAAGQHLIVEVLRNGAKKRIQVTLGPAQ